MSSVFLLSRPKYAHVCTCCIMLITQTFVFKIRDGVCFLKGRLAIPFKVHVMFCFEQGPLFIFLVLAAAG